MKNRFFQAALVSGAAMLLSAATAFPLFGAVRPGSIDVLYHSKVENGPYLAPGQYKVELAKNTRSPEVLFYQDGKVVAEAPANLVDRSKKTDQTKVYYNTADGQHFITQIDLRGSTENIMFNSAKPGMAGNSGS